MAGFVIGGLFAAKRLYGYNRKNFMFDRKLKQERIFQEQDMRIEQFALYREDVRDLVELTVGKMDLYLVASALLLDRIMVMMSKAHEAFPASLPTWAVTLNAISLASAIFYLFLTLWLAMYASISAQSFGARLLTQFVRLPYATQEQLHQATAQGQDYEARGVRDMLRVPVLQRSGPGTRDDELGAAAARSADPGGGFGMSSSSADDANPANRLQGSLGAVTQISPDGQWDLLPAALLDHIRLYRRVQLNWQAYDAYARVSLFAGASSMLYCCLYWSLGCFQHLSKAPVPAISCALIFATVQVMLTRLDLKLDRRAMTILGGIMCLSPIVTWAGLSIADVRAVIPSKAGDKWQFLELLCGIIGFGLHTSTTLLLLLAAWPDPECDKDALLPGRFRSTLYLDVFGWLLKADANNNNVRYSPSGPLPKDNANAAEGLEQSTTSGTEALEGNLNLLPAAVALAEQPPLRQGNFSPRIGSGSCASGSSLLPRFFPNAENSPRASASLPPRLPILSREGSRDVDMPGAEPPPLGSLGSSMSASVPPGAQPTIDRTAGSSGSLPPRLPLTRTPLTRSDTDLTSQRNSSRRPSLDPSSLVSLVRRVGSGSADDARQRIREFSQQIDFTPDVHEDARRLWNTENEEAALMRRFQVNASQRNRNDPSRWGGREASSLEEVAQVTSPSADTAASFGQARPPGRVEGRLIAKNLPGIVPWRAFRQGTSVIALVWVVSFFWVISGDVRDRRADQEHHEHGHERRLGESLLAPAELQGWIARAVCAAGGWGHLPSAVELNVKLQRALVLRSPRDECNLKRPVIDVAFACRRWTSPRREVLDQERRPPRREQCVAALLRRGGRSVSLCHVRLRGEALLLSHHSRLRLASGVPSLSALALRWPEVAGTPPSDGPCRAHFRDLRFFAAAAAYQDVMVLRPTVAAASPRRLLVPGIELARAGAAAALLPDGAREKEQLSLHDAILLSMRPVQPPHASGDYEGGVGVATCSSAEHADAASEVCTVAFGIEATVQWELHAWDLATGAYAARRLLPGGGSASVALAALCAVQGRGPPSGAGAQGPQGTFPWRSLKLFSSKPSVPSSGAFLRAARSMPGA